jgi:5-formyltetrahydrofolate cyclo-ligase
MTPQDDKPALRRHFRALRRDALAEATLGLRAAAVAQLPALLSPGLRLGLYWPVGAEPDLDPWAPGGLAERLADAGDAGRLALPAVLPPQSGEPQGRLIYLPWRLDAPLRSDACGIPAPLPPDGEPPQGLAAQVLSPGALGLLLVPALAIDHRGIRLGSGGGWYDRLRADPAWRAVPAVAVLPSACVVEALPSDPWDVPFDGWLDEHGLHALQGQTEAAQRLLRLDA